MCSERLCCSLLVALLLCLTMAMVGCAAAPRTLDFDSQTADEFARDLAQAVNRWRSEHQRAPLEWHEELAKAARSHSRDMAERRFFAHRDPDGRNVQERLWVAGLLFHRAGENLAQVSPVVLQPDDIVAAWAASPGHRNHLLGEDFRHTGIGVYWVPEICYVTQIFADLLVQD